MDIRLVWLLGPEEEERIARALVAAIGEILDGSPLQYAVRIRTSDQKIFEKAHPALGNGLTQTLPPADDGLLF